MKKALFIIIISFTCNTLTAQRTELTEAELKTQLDSVLSEAHMLYKYEKAAWISTDLAMESKSIIKEYGGFFTYEEHGEIKVIILGRKSQICIAEYSFEDDFTKPKSAIIGNRELSNNEKNLLVIKNKIIKNLSNKKYDVSIPTGYSPNLIFLPFAEKFKLYVIMGTTQIDVIPFGNDYLFIANKKGKIESWQKFHSRLIPGHTKHDGEKVTELIHSHLRTTPLITATDICTFMLYAPLYDIDSFSVYSPAIGKYMKYSLINDEITVK